MKNKRTNLPQNYGQTTPDPKTPETPPVDRTADSAVSPQEDREYDHRGIAMPRRSRIGGIITPQ
jgi:hypothetical protein